jgi:hypothetical protein
VCISYWSRCSRRPLPGPTHRMPGRLRRAASGNKNRLISPIHPPRLIQVKIGALLRLIPKPLIVIQIINRRRMGETIVEITGGFGRG